MQLIEESEYGAYVRTSPAFAAQFPCIEDNPNFAAFKRGRGGLVVAKCSRIADDDDMAAGRYGIDFHRALPSIRQARAYAQRLPQALADRQYPGNFAFAARRREEYRLKQQAYLGFYSCIFGTLPQVVYVAPHCGDVHRQPDHFLPQPRLEIDSWTAGLAATCALNTDAKVEGRIMVSLHSNGYLGAAIDIGTFGLRDNARLLTVAERLNRRYRQRIQQFAPEYYRDFIARAHARLRRILERNGTLHPAKLGASTADSYDVTNIVKGLTLYGQRLRSYSDREFERAFAGLQQCEVPVVSVDGIFPGRHIGRLLNLRQRIEAAMLSGAIQIECSKIYLAREPELMAQITLDIVAEYFAAA